MEEEEEGISNICLESLIRSARVPGFLGVFSVDRIPFFVQNDYFCLVFNMSVAGTRGTHFVAVVVTPAKIIYLDPMGMRPFQHLFMQCVRQWKRRRRQGRRRGRRRSLIYNPAQLQPAYSNLCGYYCFYFLLLASRYVPYQLTPFIPYGHCMNDATVFTNINALLQGRHKEKTTF